MVFFKHESHVRLWHPSFTLQNRRCVNLWNNFPCIITLVVLSKIRNSCIQTQRLYMFQLYKPNKHSIVIPLFFTVYLAEMLQNILQSFANQQNTLLPFTWTLNFIIIMTFRLGKTTLILKKDDFKFVTYSPCLLRHTVQYNSTGIYMNSTCTFRTSVYMTYSLIKLEKEL